MKQFTSTESVRFPEKRSKGIVEVGMGLLILLGVFSSLAAGEPPAEQQKASPQRGYELLRTQPYLPPDFDQETFETLWKIWPEPLRSQAEQATPEERRTMAFARYGLVETPGEQEKTGPGWGYVRTETGWVMNCLACHGGKVHEEVIPGLPNSLYALQTLTEDVRLRKLLSGKSLAHLDGASLKMPLGTTIGTTNSVVFGIALAAVRDRDLNVDFQRPDPVLLHHDMDAPPLWNVKKKSMLYIDGHAPKNHRVIMQFMLLPTNSGETVRSWESDFRNVLAWIESLEAPRYPFEIDQPLAARGKTVFTQNCAKCHGTYGEEETWPAKLIPIDEIGTDPVRLKALSVEHVDWMKESWMTHYGMDPVNESLSGYVAPPLDGIWASAPYFHNGSVPTLWHLLHPEERPAIWKRTENGYDQQRVGLEVITYRELPNPLRDPAEKRRYFDTSQPGKSAAGHDYPSTLNEDERTALLEYLKTL